MGLAFSEGIHEGPADLQSCQRHPRLAALDPLVDESHQHAGWTLSTELQHFDFDDVVDLPGTVSPRFADLWLGTLNHEP
jgi:hypothetical protein